MRGRRPSGPGCVEQLPGTARTKERLRVVLQTVAGELRVSQACARLGVGEARFRQLRRQALQGAMDALEARPAGRPRHEPSPDEQRLQALEGRLAEQEAQLHAARLREEIALVLPRVVQPPTPEKKTRRQRPRRP